MATNQIAVGKKIWSNSGILEKFLFFTLVLFLGALLFQGIVYPPNNWDSLTYHMTRIMYWLGNGSVAHFPAHILRHLYQPPFAEYFIMHVNLIQGNDYLANSVQLLFLIFSLYAVYKILSYLKVPRKYKILALFLLITIPSVELQSTTTKNDIVCSLFILSSLLFSLKAYADKTLSNFIYLGLSIGLAFLTKGTAYLFLFPILLLFGLFTLRDIIKNKSIQPFYYGIVLILITVTLNIGHYTRNYSVDGNILNIDKSEANALSNQKMNGKLLASNLLKNAGLHLGYPVEIASDSLIKKIHREINVPIDNPDTNYFGLKYEGAKKNMTNEDLVPNLIHFILITSSIFVLFIIAIRKPKNNSIILMLLFVIITQIVLFSGFLKWQPWHTRLHIPIFIASVILITLTAYKSKFYYYLIVLTIPILCYSFGFYFLYNNTRPIITNPEFTKEICLTDSRFKKYFANQLQLRKEYTIVVEKLYDINPRKVGLILTDFEYPLLRDYYYDRVQFVALKLGNISGKIPQDETNISCIISNSQNKEFIEHDGKNYINQTPNNSYIWIYK
ncbi:hypothetical protein FEDK69T_06150 [Flavobacterium enshiense DK69]|uniref:Glycosyltransferase RgtA/B/C/D-like domain-containing protein n=1 Tax=Flavobacterium enshiense DK69 TaxID=1107311 RepID=V6SBZ7_9FLAO|nr:glycosyltransferase family 39 protein [Flavobacterium enshiense]ESU24178.1 hypothetical protein FEDK69T_06150 [Flavobacterium enshiense DK69]KGO95446.1 hypothetical protein Q767_11630 [Flavobacterium enshiense DK69]